MTNKSVERFANCLSVGAALLLGAFAAFMCCGCVSPGSQPAKSQTFQIRDCTINVAGTPAGDLLSQNQYLESSGTETYSPVATPTQTITPRTSLSTTSGAGGVASLVGGAVSGLVSGLSGDEAKASGTAAAEAEAAEDCADGTCTPRE